MFYNFGSAPRAPVGQESWNLQIYVPLTPKIHHITFEKNWQCSFFKEEVKNVQLLMHIAQQQTTNDENQLQFRSPEWLRWPEKHNLDNISNSKKTISKIEKFFFIYICVHIPFSLTFITLYYMYIRGWFKWITSLNIAIVMWY